MVLPAILPRDSEMSELILNKEWSNTSVQHPDTWPQSLLTSLSLVMHSRFPMLLMWGPDLLCFYNDAFRPSLGLEGKHPSILGMPAREAWKEVWLVIGSMIEQIVNGGAATWSEDQLVPIYRNGQLENVYWTYSYSRISNDLGAVGGVLVTCVETTQKVASQKKLEETAEQFHFAIESAELGTWDYNPRTGQFSSNQRLKDWLGLQTDEQTDLDIAIAAIAPEDRERVMTAIAGAIDASQRAPYEIQYSIINKLTAQQIIVLVKGKAYFDKGQHAYRFSGTMEDITNKANAAKLRIEAEQNLRNMIAQAPVAMCVLKGPDHVVAMANNMIIDLWGKEQGEVMNKPIFEGLPEAKGQGLEILLDAVYRTGERFTATERPVQLPREDTIVTVYQNFVYEPLRKDDGSIEGVIAVTIDVTRQVMARQILEEAEERARSAVAAGNMGTFDLIFGEQHAVISDRFCEIFDVSPESAHAVLLSRIHPEDIQTRHKAIQDAIDNGPLHYEVRVVHRNGTIRWVRAEGKVLKDLNGQRPPRMLGTVIDITELKELERHREEYIAIASHELKNPLTALKLSLDMLSSMVKERDSSFYVHKSREQVNRIIALASNLLNVSKIAAGILEIKPEVFHFGTVVEESVISVAGGVQSDRFQLSGLLDISIIGDRFRIEQVIINLLSNAIKYSPIDTPIALEVNLMPGWLRVSVKDKGIGIDKDKIPFVFQKFSRLEPGAGVDGHGLGLYITEQIIRRHNGRIGVESEKGRGSTFWFMLPL